jgi:hypothetical protein
MKTIQSLTKGLAIWGMVLLGTIQVALAQRAALVSIDLRGMGALDSSMIAQIARTEASKIVSYEMMDRYDIEEILRQKSTTKDPCYSKTCLVAEGKILGAQIMITGTVERLGNKISVNLREISVNEDKITRTYVEEFLYLPSEMNRIFRVSFNSMYGKTVDPVEMKSLIDPTYLPGGSNNPESIILKTSGPRFGFTGFTGKAAEYIQRPKVDGGLEGIPVMFQFGYQFEKQYLNEGNFQGLLEFIPMITGADQGQFIPSFSLLNGFRSQKSGLEIAFGPSFSFSKVAEGYFDSAGTWKFSYAAPVPYTLEDRLDSRGTTRLNPSFIIGVGKTFKKGRMNMPVNAWVRPSKSSTQFGVSWGFNVQKAKVDAVDNFR